MQVHAIDVRHRAASRGKQAGKGDGRGLDVDLEERRTRHASVIGEDLHPEMRAHERQVRAAREHVQAGDLRVVAETTPRPRSSGCSTR